MKAGHLFTADNHQEIAAAMLTELAEQDPERHRRAREATGYQGVSSLPAPTDPWWEAEEALQLLDTLAEFMNELAPPYTRFGPGPEEAGQFGFWLTPEAPEQLPMVPRPENLEELDTEEALVVTEHTTALWRWEGAWIQQWQIGEAPDE